MYRIFQRGKDSVRSLALLFALVVTLPATDRNVEAVERPRAPKHEFTFVVLGDSQFYLPNTFNKIIDEIVHLYPASSFMWAT